MSHSVYFDLKEINALQQLIMEYVNDWVHTQKTPIPQRDVITGMKLKGVKDFTTVNALHVLIKKGYLRRAVTTTNRTYYVMLRGI